MLLQIAYTHTSGGVVCIRTYCVCDTQLSAIVIWHLHIGNIITLMNSVSVELLDVLRLTSCGLTLSGQLLWCPLWTEVLRWRRGPQWCP